MPRVYNSNKNNNNRQFSSNNKMNNNSGYYRSNGANRGSNGRYDTEYNDDGSRCRMVKLPNYVDKTFKGRKDDWNDICRTLCKVIKEHFQSDIMFHVCQQIHRGLYKVFNIRQEIFILRIVAKYETQLEALFEYYREKYYGNKQVNKQGKFKYPRFSIKMKRDTAVLTNYDDDKKNCPIKERNFQFSLTVDGDMNLHKMVMTANGPLRCIFAYEEESTKADRKAQNQTDKFVHYIPYDQDENNYDQYYECQIDGQQVSWDVLDSRALDCKFVRMNYKEQAALDENIKRRNSVIELYKTKLTEDKNKYIKQTYIRVYAFMKFEYVWEFYKIEKADDPRLKLQECIEFILEVLDTFEWDKEVIASIMDRFNASTRYERNFFQNVVVEEVEKLIRKQQNDLKNKANKEVYLYDECFAQMDEIIEGVKNISSNSQQSESDAKMDEFTKAAVEQMEKLKKIVASATETTTTKTVQHPYIAGKSYQITSSINISEESLEFYMKERYIHVLDYCISDHKEQFTQVVGNQYGQLFEKLNRLRATYSITASIIEKDICENNLFNNRKTRRDEITMLKSLLPVLRLLQAIILRKYVCSYNKPQKDDQMGREEMLAYFRLFSCRVYTAELRLKYLEAEYDLSKVDLSTINCDVSIDLSEKFSNNMPVMLRDYETIFTNFVQKYNKSPAYKDMFPELTDEERRIIKEFVMSLSAEKKE